MPTHRIRPGTGRGHPGRRGGVGWEIRRQNSAADDGSGFVYAFSGMGGLAGDVIKTGHTRNHPAVRAQVIFHANLSAHWRHERAIRSAHRSNPPQLWACHVPDRRAAERAIHQRLLEADTGAIDLGTVLAAMTEVTGHAPERYSLVVPPRPASTFC
jgi:hypothetical protein